MFKITEELLLKILILTTFVVYFYLSLQFPSIPLQERKTAETFITPTKEGKINPLTVKTYKQFIVNTTYKDTGL